MVAPSTTAQTSAPSSGFQVSRTAALSQPSRSTPTAARAVATENASSTATVSSGAGYGVRILQNGVALARGGIAQDFPAAGQSIFRTTGRHVVTSTGSPVVVKAQITALGAAATVDSSNANLSGLWLTVKPRTAL